MSDQSKQQRETKRVDQLQPGDIVADGGWDEDLERMVEEFRQIRLVEPLDSRPEQFLVVFAGGRTAIRDGGVVFDLATATEYSEHEAKLRDAEKRARMRAGFMQVVDAIDQGLPLPDHFSVEAACMPDHAAVAAAAVLLGREVKESVNGGRRQTEVRADFAARQFGAPEVGFRLWHLGGAAES